MVAFEASGVMFTDNPLTTATDETVISSSWGLGESVVSGIILPDTFTLKTGGILRIKVRTTGAKELRIPRDPSKDQGTVTEPNTEAEQSGLSLTDDQVIQLARLGRCVQEHYDSFPQDIGWAMENGKFYMFQSGPITGVEFSWYADVDDWRMFHEDGTATWTRPLADENRTGAILPLMYSFRGYSWAQEHEWDTVEKTIPPMMHPGLMANLPSAWRKDAQEATFSGLGYVKLYARVEAMRPQLYK